jgi:hypothetical protein
MSVDISLKQIERKAYRSTFHDGLSDIQLGLLLMGLAIAPWLEHIGISTPFNFLPVVAIPILVHRYGKKWITVPRMGLVRFGPQRKTNKKRLQFIAIILCLITVTQVILTISGAFPPDWMVGLGEYSMPIIFSLSALLVFCIFAYFKDFPRLVLIGVLFGAGIMFAEYLHFHVGSPLDGLIGLGIPGVIVLTMGLILLSRFMKKYPKPVKAEVSDGSQ